MKMNSGFYRKMDIFLDIERHYFENEAQKKISGDSIKDKNLIKHLREEYVKKCIQDKNDKPSVNEMLNVLYSSQNFFQRETVKNHYNIEDKYLIMKDYPVEIIDSVETAIVKLNKNNLTRLDDQDNRNYFFRGHECIDYRSIPSIMRKKEFYVNEDQLYYELQTISPKNFSHSNKHLDILTDMQHFSLPTRLLDISSNPISALFFATTMTDPNSVYKDGEVIVLSAHQDATKNFSSDTVEIQNSLAFLPYSLKEEIYKVAKEHKGRKPKMERIESFIEVKRLKNYCMKLVSLGYSFQMF